MIRKNDGAIRITMTMLKGSPFSRHVLRRIQPENDGECSDYRSCFAFHLPHRRRKNASFLASLCQATDLPEFVWSKPLLDKLAVWLEIWIDKLVVFAWDNYYILKSMSHSVFDFRHRRFPYFELCNVSLFVRWVLFCEVEAENGKRISVWFYWHSQYSG